MVDVIVPTNAVCDKMLPNNLPWDKYTDSQICAGGADKDACQGKDFIKKNKGLNSKDCSYPSYNFNTYIVMCILLVRMKSFPRF